MTNYLKEAPVNQPKFITQAQLDFMKSRFEREVIDPLFFGHFGETDGQIKDRQAQIDAVDAKFRKLVTDNFEVSNLMEE